MPISLLYHDVTERGADDCSGFAGPTAARYKLTPHEFAQHLNRIAANVTRPPLTTTRLDELQRAKPDDWLLSFDDGGLSAATEIAAQLEQRGWRGWFFIATDFLDQPSFCSREQVADLHRRGHVIGSHSCSHPERISDCPWSQLLDEWKRSRDLLSEIVGEPVMSASVPGGFYSDQVAQAALAAGLNVIFNSEPTTATVPFENGLVLGRYNIYRGMSAEDAASLLASPFRRWRQSAFWSAKKIAKTWAGPLYKAAREKWLGRAYGSAPSASTTARPAS